MPEQKMCSQSGCTDEARVAIKTGAPRGNFGTLGLNTKIWWDEREAPNSAQCFCKPHGVLVLDGLAEVLIAND